MKGRQKADGTYPIYIVVSRPPKRFLVNSGLSSSTIFSGNIFPTKERNSRAKTAKLTSMIEAIEDLCLKNSRMSDADLKLLIESNVLGKGGSDRTHLIYYIREYSKTCKTARTSEIYEATAKKVEAFDPSSGLDIDKKWLTRFEESMRKTMSVNACSIHLRNIRAVMNWAIDNDWTENYPFRKFKIRHTETRKRNLSAKTIASFITMSVEPYQERYGDFFLLCFYLIGINGVDILEAKPEQVVDGRLEYERRKTHKLYSVKIEPEAMSIIDKYRGKEHLLEFADKAHYRNFMAKANSFLQTIDKRYTQYYCRHSWASIASELNIPIDTISAALGHSYGSSVTQVYINFNQKKVDAANRKVINCVLKSKE